MKALIYEAFGISMERRDEEPVIIGTEQTLITVKDALGAIDEYKLDVDESEEEIGDLEEVETSLEAIALAIRAQIREGGMTPAIALTHSVALEQLLGQAGLETQQYVISHESFAHDPIAVSLEAERTVKEAAKAVSSKLMGTITKALGEMELYIKSFSAVSKGLKTHANELKKEIAALPTPETVPEVNAAKVTGAFHQGGQFDGRLEIPLNKVINAGETLVKFSNGVKGVVDKLITQASAGNYTEGDYVAALEKATSGVHDTYLPGGQVLTKDKNKPGQLVLVKDDSSAKDPGTLKSPDQKKLTLVCDRVIALADFIDQYNRLLIDNEKEMKKLMTVLDKKPGTEGAAAMGALGADSIAFMAALRGCGPSYIRYTAMQGKEALNFVSKCVKAHAV